MATHDADVEVLGVRHHGPGSARSVDQALAEVRPDLVVIEGVPELDRVADLAAGDDMVPPVAGLVYAVDTPRRALFYPMAEFSPEWVALRWALRHDVPVRFADLPATHQLAPDPEDAEDAEPDAQETEPADLEEVRVRSDPLGRLAEAAGYDDPERWWEDAVEHRSSSGLERFAAVRLAMAELRERDDEGRSGAEVRENARREAAMRRVLRAVLKEGHGRVAVVCGAYHAPVLVPSAFPPASQDAALLSGLPKVKVAATWAPWTSQRLAADSGYGAGVRAPGWYQHLFRHWSTEAEGGVAATWLVRVARELRRQELDAAPATIVEATRLADALAAVRGRPSVGLTELDDAAIAVLCGGSELPLRLVHRELTVGEELGAVPGATPAVPLAGDLARLQRSLRLKPSAAESEVALDLRRDAGRARSVLLHRLALLGIPWGTPVDEGWRSTGTFKEVWRLAWDPEYAVLVIDASLYGTTIASAADARVAELAEESTDIASLAALVSTCLVADLVAATSRVVSALEEKTAQQHDTVALLRAVEPLARTLRYGDVRGIDLGQLAAVLSTIVTRASVGLPAACAGIDDEGAAEVRAAIDAAARGIALLDDAALATPWTEAVSSVAATESVHGSVSGRLNRILLDGGLLDSDAVARRMSRRLSVASPAPEAAAWLDGFLSGESVILVHDRVLLGVVDAWVSEVGDDAFEDLLPIVRRTFAQFAAPERRVIGEQLRRTDAPTAAAGDDEYDLERAWPAVQRVASLLGIGAVS